MFDYVLENIFFVCNQFIICMLYSYKSQMNIEVL